MKNKIFAFAVLIAILLCSCTRQNSVNEEVRDIDSKIGDARDVTLSVLVPIYSDSTKAYWKIFKEEFEDKNKEIRLEIESFDWENMDSVVRAITSSGAVSDIALTDSFSEYLGEEPILMTTDSYLSEEVKNKLISPINSQKEYNGKYYSVPAVMSARMMVCNMQILENCGITEIPRTYDELIEAAQAVAMTYNGAVSPFGLSLSGDELVAAFAYFLWGSGGDFIGTDGRWNVDTPQSLNGLEREINLKNELEALGIDTESDLSTLQENFLNDKVAMMIAPASIVNFLNEKESADTKYEFAPIVGESSNLSTSLAIIDSFVVFDNEETEDEEMRIDAISKFFDSFYEDDNYYDYIELEGKLPTTNSVFDKLSKEDVLIAKQKDVLFLDNKMTRAEFKCLPNIREDWTSAKVRIVECTNQILEGEDIKTELNYLNNKLNETLINEQEDE